MDIAGEVEQRTPFEFPPDLTDLCGFFPSVDAQDIPCREAQKPFLEGADRSPEPPLRTSTLELLNSRITSRSPDPRLGLS